ncbi:MAG: STAS domain-containing protein [Roseiarcus sp.]|jgi:chemotaxis protein CheX
MAKESVWQRRARKCRSAKAEYYPKVDLTGSRREPEEVLSALEGLDLGAAAAPAKAEPEAASPPPQRPDSPAAAAPAATPATAEPDGAFRLPECLDLPAARPLAKALLERRGKPIVVDGSSVHQLGAQCVQVLLSAKRTWSADGVALSIVNCAPRMIEDLRLLGIDLTTLTSGEQPQCA